MSSAIKSSHSIADRQVPIDDEPSTNSNVSQITEYEYKYSPRVIKDLDNINSEGKASRSATDKKVNTFWDMCTIL